MMKHAGDESLDRLEPLLRRLRKIEGLTEKKRGVFYRKASAFVHFHEDTDELFADVKTAQGWVRCPVNRAEDRGELMDLIAEEMAP